MMRTREEMILNSVYGKEHCAHHIAASGSDGRCIHLTRWGNYLLIQGCIDMTHVIDFYAGFGD